MGPIDTNKKNYMFHSVQAAHTFAWLWMLHVKEEKLIQLMKAMQNRTNLSIRFSGLTQCADISTSL
jgi:hypothetical protein